MKQYNWILVKKMNGGDIKVRQSRAYGDIFVDEQGNEYLSRNLDFTDARLAIPDFNEQNKENLNALKDMMKSMDANSIADHKAKIEEREYWRKLRGDIALEIIRKRGDKGHYDTASHFVTIADMTRVLFNELYDQDKEFFKDEDNDQAQ